MKFKVYISWLTTYLRSGRAVSALEYAIIVGVLIVGISAALYTFRDNINTVLNRHSAAILTVS